jgi:uncharacterized protein
MLLWQPTVSGHRFVQQYFRSRVMSDAMVDGRAKATTASLFAELAQGNPVEVAGYTLSPDLVLPIDEAAMSPLPAGSAVRWIEMVETADANPGAGVANTLEEWRAAGVDATAAVVEGPPFWQTQEIVECRALIQSTVALMSR